VQPLKAPANVVSQVKVVGDDARVPRFPLGPAVGLGAADARHEQAGSVWGAWGDPATSGRDATISEGDSSVVRILRELEESRSTRWCGLKEGSPPVVVRSLQKEARLIEELVAVVEAGGDSLASDSTLEAASDLAGAGFLKQALAVLDGAGEGGRAGEALFLRSLCLDKLDQSARAAKGYDKYARGGGLLADYALLLKAKCLKREGYLAAAAKTLTSLVEGWEDSPVWAEAATELCEYYLSLERYENCAGVGELMASKAPRDTDKRTGLYYLAQAMEGAGRDGDAAGIYWRLVADYPSHPKAGLAFRALSRIKSKLNEGLTDAELYRGGIALFKTGNLADAHGAFQKLVARGKGREHWRDGVREMAQVSYARKHYSEASKEYLMLAEGGGPEADEAMLWVGKCELRAGRCKRAFEILDALGRGEADPSIRADALWEAARERESQGLLAEAADDYYYTASILPHTRQGPEACWRLGFCRYLTDDYEGAREAFALASGMAGAPYLKAQCLYWLGKTLWRLDRRSEAESALRSAAAEGLDVYYGARAAWILEADPLEIERESFVLRRLGAPSDERSHPGGADSLTFDYVENGSDAPSDSIRKEGFAGGARGGQPYAELADLANSDCRSSGPRPGLWGPRCEASRGGARWHFERGLRLLSWGELGRGAMEVRAASKLGLDKDEAIAVLSFHDCYNDAMLLAGSPQPRAGCRPADDYLYASFPLGFADHVWRHCEEAGLDPFLALSIIRQESRFDPEAVSSAGARGLMQLLPSTGRRLFGDVGMRWRGDSGLLDPATNTQMGTRYFGEMLERLGNLPAALAAYNGGVSKAREWAMLAEGKGLDSYIEMIGYRETRTYVKLVIMQYLTYLRLYVPQQGHYDSSPASAASGVQTQQDH
jgi:tetratricopeptide (TPR) repeat protein